MRIFLSAFFPNDPRDRSRTKRSHAGTAHRSPPERSKTPGKDSPSGHSDRSRRSHSRSRCRSMCGKPACSPSSPSAPSAFRPQHPQNGPPAHPKPAKRHPATCPDQSPREQFSPSDSPAMARKARDSSLFSSAACSARKTLKQGRLRWRQGSFSRPHPTTRRAPWQSTERRIRSKFLKRACQVRIRRRNVAPKPFP